MDIHAFLRQKLQSTLDEFTRDLMAMTGEQLNTSPGGVARSGYDFAYEVAVVNRRIAMRIRGEVPEKIGPGWIMAPDDLRVRDRIVDECTKAGAELMAAWDALPATDLERTIELPNGSTTNPVDLMFMAIYHTGYHDAQLNYLQSIFGDGEVHWES